MASQWGINRTMAQIHALLYASEEPMDTDEIMEALQISRGNANMNLRSLIQWDLAQKVHLAGSRKDFYKAEKDVWKITARIIKERQKREIKPIKDQLQHCLDILNCGEGGQPSTLETSLIEQQFHERIETLLELMKMFEEIFDTLFPFVQERNMREAKQFINLVRQLTVDAEEND